MHTLALSSPWYRGFFSNLRLRWAAKSAASAEPRAVEDMSCESREEQSPLYTLAASNPHIIATSLFSKPRR